MKHEQTIDRRAFLQGAGAFTGLGLAGCWGGNGPRIEKPTKILFMTDHHVESDFVQSHGLTKGQPEFTMWKPGNHAALVATYRFVNEDPRCSDCDVALFGGDQLNTGYSYLQSDLDAERVNYFRTLDALDLHARTHDRTANLDFVTEPYVIRENLGRGQKPIPVTPRPPVSRVIAIQGNHDTGVEEFYRDCAFTTGDCRVITFFASYVGLPPPPGHKFASTAKIADHTIDFIAREMSRAAANPKIRHIILASHWAIAPKGKDFGAPIIDACRENGMSDNRKKLLALAEKYGCDLYLNGHEHNGRYPMAQVGCLTDISCGTVSNSKGGAFATFEIRRDCALVNIYSRAFAEEKDGNVLITATPKLVSQREISLTPIRA